jgi:hypothetical protein
MDSGQENHGQIKFPDSTSCRGQSPCRESEREGPLKSVQKQQDLTSYFYSLGTCVHVSQYISCNLER